MLRPRLFRLSALLMAAGLLVGACNDDGRTMRKPDADKTASISVPSTTSTTEPPLIETGKSVGSSLPTEPLEGLDVTAPWALGAVIPAKYTCAGANVSPALSWPKAPEGTIEIAITMTDEDAPQYVHWALAGLEPATTSVGEGVVPDSAIQATNSAGTVGYTGPCPPAGATHTYTIEVHFLSQQLEVAAAEPAAEMVLAIRSATVSSAITSGTAAGSGGAASTSSTVATS